MKKFCSGLMVVLAVSGMLALGGCAALLVGAGVGAGLAISKDSARLDMDRSVNQAWIASSKVVNQMGVVTLEDHKEGRIEANIQDAKVTVTITPITPKSVRIEVKARKNLLPQMDLTTDIINKIHDQLKSSWM